MPGLKKWCTAIPPLEPEGITSTITALIPGRRNRPVSGRNAGQCGGYHANQPALRPGIPACRLRRVRLGPVVRREPGIHRGGSKAALYGGRDAALLRGNPGCRAHYRLHAQATGEPQRRLPQCFRQARAIRSSEIRSGRRQRRSSLARTSCDSSLIQVWRPLACRVAPAGRGPARGAGSTCRRVAARACRRDRSPPAARRRFARSP